MEDRVSWALEASVKSGRIEDVRALMNEMVASTRAEPGALGYEWFVGDGGSMLLLERYADSAAALAHLGTFGRTFAGRFLDLLDPTRFTVMGAPSGELSNALSG